MADHNQWVESRAQELQDDLEKSQQTITELRRQLAAKDREIKGLEYEVIELDELRQSAEAERNTSRKAQEQLRQQLRQLQMQQPHLRPDETSPVPIADHRSARHDDTFPETNHGASVPYCSRKSLAPNCVAKSSGEEQSRPNSQIRENLDYKRNAKQRSRDGNFALEGTHRPDSMLGQHQIISHMASLIHIPAALDTDAILSRLRDSRRTHELSCKRAVDSRNMTEP